MLPILFVSMILSLLLTFSAAVNAINTNKRNARTVLDSYVTTDSIAIFDALKNSSNNTQTVKSNAFIESLSEYCRLEKKNGTLYYYDDSGNEIYKMSEPTLSFIVDDELKVRAVYEITVPLRFGGAVITQATVPIVIEAFYNDKF